MSVSVYMEARGGKGKLEQGRAEGLCSALQRCRLRSSSSGQTRGKSLLGGMPGDRPRSGGLVSTLSPFCSNMARRLRTPLIVAVVLGGTAREERRAVSGLQGARDGDGKSGCCDGYGRIGLGGRDEAKFVGAAPFWRRASWERVALELPRAKTTARPIAGSKRESREVTMRS